MKLLAVIFCLVVSMGALGQSRDTVRKDTSLKWAIRDPAYIARTKVLYIIDNKRFYTSSDDLTEIMPKPEDIEYIKVLKEKEAIGHYGKKGKNGAVVITTKKFLINSYKTKLSNFSQEYRDFMSKHQNGDKDFEYVLNGTSLGKVSNDVSTKLYEISAKKIKSVNFKINPSYNGWNYSATVNITTKK